MGMAKRMMEERDRLEGIARGILVETGALAPCELHDDVLIDQGDEEAVTGAYKLANARITSGTIEADRRDMTDAIKSAADDGAIECYSCARLMED